MKEINNIKSVFFGTPSISVHFLEELKKEGFLFDLIITNPNRPVGRKKVVSATPVKTWAIKNNIEYISPEKLNNEIIKKIKDYELFFVLAYGKILKQEVLDLPRMGVWNLHPSLLPQYRGPSPIMSAMLDDQKETGVSLILLDEKMDHGPILAQERVTIEEWKQNNKMEKDFAEKGAHMLLGTLKNINSIEAQEQKHDKATYCEKYQKSDMELGWPLEQRKNFLKFLAFPKPFFIKDGKRYIVTDGIWEDGVFKILKVIPEGKKEQEWKK